MAGVFKRAFGTCLFRPLCASRPASARLQPGSLDLRTCTCVYISVTIPLTR